MTEQIKGNNNIVVKDNTDSDITIQNFYKSLEYKELTERIEEMRDLMQSTTDEVKRLKYSQKLNGLENQLEGFKRDIIQLAETFQKINIDTERLRLAKQHFDNGEYKAARAVLNAEQMTGELDALLAEKERLSEKTSKNTAYLKDKANEFLILAKLTATDYDLGEERFTLAREYFEKSLKADRNIDVLHNYADFLRFHNELNDSERLYDETINKSEFLAKESPKYQEYTIDLLNDVAGVYRLLGKTELAIHSMEKVVTYRRQNGKFSSKTANALSNLGILYEEKNKLKKSEESYLEALEIVKRLASSDPKYSYDVSKVLNNLGIVYQKKGNIEKEEDAYTEALDILMDVYETDLEKYLPLLADMLDNKAGLLRRKGEYVNAENAFEKSLNIREFLVSINPKAYLPSLIQTQTNMFTFYYFDKPSGQKSVSLANKVIETSLKFKNIPYGEECSELAKKILKKWSIEGCYLEKYRN